MKNQNHPGRPKEDRWGKTKILYINLKINNL